MSAKYKLGIRRQDWAEVIAEIERAGFSRIQLCKIARCTLPTLSAIRKGFSEPRYSQGQRLLAARSAVAAGKMTPENF